MNLCSITDVRGLLNQYGLRPNKRFGQNFLIDRNVLGTILRSTGLEPGESVLEIGPGLGCLSVELAQRAGKVICVEVDPAMIEMTNVTLVECDNVTVVNSDILRVTPDDLGIAPGAGWILVGNLPYYITSPILEWLAKYTQYFKRSVMMVQKEVAERLLASPGSPDYSSLTVFLSYYFKVSRAANVSRNVFFPAPDVDSTIIVLDTLPAPAVTVHNEEVLFKVVRAAFAMRRKTLENALGNSPLLNWGKERAALILSKAGIDKGLRGEKLTITQFGEIAEAAYELPE